MSPIEKFTQKTTKLAEDNLESPQIYAKKEEQKNRVNLANNVDEINKIVTITIQTTTTFHIFIKTF